MIQLYYFPGNASLAPHILLEELGVRFALVLVGRAVEAQRSREFLTLNPNGQIPVLVHGDLVLYESAAICLYLTDAFPAMRLVPALQTTERAFFYKWLIWSTNTLQAMLMHSFYSERLVNDDDVDAATQRALATEGLSSPPV